MVYKENVVVVLFNPPMACIEQVLEFISSFRDTHAKLHVINDVGAEECSPKDNDILILELSLTQKLSSIVLQYVNKLYPSLNTYRFNKNKKKNKDAQSYLDQFKPIRSFFEKHPRHHLN